MYVQNIVINGRVFLAKVQERDKTFLSFDILERAIPWSFHLRKIKYMMTSSIDMILISHFHTWHYKPLSEQVLKKNVSLIADVLNLVDKKNHACTQKYE